MATRIIAEMAVLIISSSVSIPDEQIVMTAIRSQGAGGQHVNKVSSAIHLRFDIHASSLPDYYKQRLLALRDQRISNEGVIIIKAQQFRSQDKNRANALARLKQLIVAAVAHEPKVRRPTRPSKRAKKKRVDSKVRKGMTKALRGKVDHS